jgi:hypothetical protein
MGLCKSSHSETFFWKAHDFCPDRIDRHGITPTVIMESASTSTICNNSIKCCISAICRSNLSTGTYS